MHDSMMLAIVHVVVGSRGPFFTLAQVPKLIKVFYDLSW